MPPVRALVVDDSALMRKLVTEILSGDARIEVIGQARDGADALKKIDDLRPDVVTLDVEMPIMDGLAALEEIMRRRPTPVVMLSSLTREGADTTFRCLERGAVDFVAKPGGSISLNIAAVTAELTDKVVHAARARVFACSQAPQAASARPMPPPPPGDRFDHRKEHLWRPCDGALLIGASTGGPRALQAVVPALPADLPVPVVIVQHMPPGFTALLAQRLDSLSALTVREAAQDDRLLPGHVLLAPGGHHLTFGPDGLVRLTDEPPIHGVRPAIDVTLDSLTRLCGRRLVAVLLTGMGRDGARGMKTLRGLGGRTLAEDESTCVVYGMPRAASEIGGVDRLLPITEIASAAAAACRH